MAEICSEYYTQVSERNFLTQVIEYIMGTLNHGTGEHTLFKTCIQQLWLSDGNDKKVRGKPINQGSTKQALDEGHR